MASKVLGMGVLLALPAACLDVTPRSLETGEGVLAGVVRDVSGELAAEANVYLHGHLNMYAPTDLNGRFRLDGVPAGQHTVVAFGRQGLAASIDATVFGGETTEVELTLVQAASLRGVVTLAGQDDHGGTLVYIPGTAANAFTDPTGAFRLVVVAGCYSVRVEHPEYRGRDVGPLCVAVGEEGDLDRITLLRSDGQCRDDGDCAEHQACRDRSCVYLSGYGPEICDSADNDGDGMIDEGIAEPCPCRPGVSICLAGKMTDCRSRPPITPGRMAKHADVNGDGCADLVGLLSTGSTCYWDGHSDGSFGSAIWSFNRGLDPALFDHTGYYLVDVADVDGNGTADLVTIATSGSAFVHHGGPGGFCCGDEEESVEFCCGVSSLAGTMTLAENGPNGHEPVAVADVDGDGRADLVTVHTNGSVYVYAGAANRTFGAPVVSLAGQLDSAVRDGKGHYPLDVADVTGDGRADLVTVHDDRSAYLFPGLADGSFGSPVRSLEDTFGLPLSSSGAHEPVGVEDVDGDGKADLIMAYDNGIVVYRGRSDGTFAPGLVSLAGLVDSSLFDQIGLSFVGVYDVSGDGKADVTAIGHDKSVHVYLGTALGTFELSPASTASKIDTSRFDGVGYELATERLWKRRRGCGPSGC